MLPYSIVCSWLQAHRLAGSVARFRKPAPPPPSTPPEVEPHLDQHLRIDAEASVAETMSYV